MTGRGVGVPKGPKWGDVISEQPLSSVGEGGGEFLTEEQEQEQEQWEYSQHSMY